MILLTHTTSSRLQYISDFIGVQLAGQAFTIVTDIGLYKADAGPRINYTSQRTNVPELWIQPRGLLFEKGIDAQDIQPVIVQGDKALFPSEGDLPFDLFSAAFYLLSRYEEYLPHQKDSYGRYAHENSIAFREKFLHLPLVNRWIHAVRERLRQLFPSAAWVLPPLPSGVQKNFLPTYDIDEAWSYLHKDGFRQAGAIVKAALKGQWNRIAERIRVIRGKESDPYDSYEWMDSLHRRLGLQPLYFFLVPAKTSRYDRNILPREKSLQALIHKEAGAHPVGIHPSWQSGDNPFLISKEIDTLQTISGIPIHQSRQHYIRFTLPQTFRYLLEAGIQTDYSMGYGTINGFRASVASPFFWYDLEREEATSLFLYPFCFMEANSFYEQHRTPQQALEEMRAFYQSVRTVNGIFISIWHNSFFGTEKAFSGWREIYEEFVQEIFR